MFMDEPIRRPASNMVGTVWAPPMSHPPVFFLFTVSETFRGKFKQKESHQIKWMDQPKHFARLHTHTHFVQLVLMFQRIFCSGPAESPS